MSETSSKFPKPGTVLWAVNVELEVDVFRSGAASKPNTEYLRFVDIGMDDREGRIGEDSLDKYVVKAGQGISLFLERMIPEGLVLMDASQWKQLDKKKQKKITGGVLNRVIQFQRGLNWYTMGILPGIAPLQ